MLYLLRRYLLIFVSCYSFSQETIGIANSNYGGTNSVFLNPSLIVDSKVYIDVNLAGSGAFVWNNYVYYDKDDLSFYRLITGIQNDVNPRDNYSIADKNGLVSLFAHGPSTAFHLKGLHAVGLHTKLRNYESLRSIPYHMAKFAFEGISAYDPQHQTYFEGEDFRIRSMTWGEIGVSYAGIIKRAMGYTISAGATLKRLYGISYHGFNMENLNYFVVDTSDLQVFNFTGDYALTSGWGSGKGFGLDIGVTYKKMFRDAYSYIPFSEAEDCQNANYIYRLSLGFIDIGGIRYKNNAFTREFQFGSGYWENYNDTDIEDTASLDGDIVEQLDNYQSTSSDTSFKAKLPTAITASFDYHLFPYVYVNSTFIQGVPRKRRHGIYRPSLISLTPRFETRYFEVAMPFALYDYRRPQLGLMFRVYGIVIGSDKLGALLFRQNVYGADIYFNVKINLYRSFKCSNKKGNSKDKDYTCPVFK